MSVAWGERKPLQRSPFKTERKPLTRSPMKRSRKRITAAERREYEIATERADGRCEAQIPGICTGRAEVRHHVKLRSALGKTIASNLIVICTECHGFIHAHPQWARDRAFIESSFGEAS